MDTWKDYKQKAKESNPRTRQDIEEMEALAAIIGPMVTQRDRLGLSQRDLAKLCGIPQSSVARIESGRTTPNLSTLLNIFRHLGLQITVSPTNTTN